MFSKKSHFLLLTMFACSLPLSSVLAEEKKQNKMPKVGGWSGNFSFGLNSSEGNSNIGRANVDFVAKYGIKKLGSLQHTFQGGYDYGDRGLARGLDRIETKNDTEINYKLNYNLAQNRSLIGFLGYEDNGRAKLESQEMFMVGYEWNGLGTKQHVFSAGLGVGYLAVDYTDDTPGFSDEALRGSFTYNGKINNLLSVSTRLVVLAAEERTMTRSVSKLDLALSKRASLVLKYKSTYYDTIPTTAIDKRDNTTTLNVLFRF